MENNRVFVNGVHKSLEQANVKGLTIFICRSFSDEAFDLIIWFCDDKMNFKIVEVPVRWLKSPYPCARLFKDPLSMVFDLLRIRAYWFIGLYEV